MSVLPLVRGCLLGVAVGEAVSGADGDRTWMVLFTAEGVLRALTRHRNRGIVSAVSVVDHAYARWLASVGELSPRWSKPFDGWLLTALGERHDVAVDDRRVAALRAGRMGTMERPVNNLADSAGLVCAAPIGLVPEDAEWRFELGCEIAAITHGDASGFLPAGVLAVVVGAVRRGASLEKAIEASTSPLVCHERSGETLDALLAARALVCARTPPSQEAAGLVGDVRRAPGALALALVCAAHAETFIDGLATAIEHGGSDVGAIAGALLGTMHGVESIPPTWLERVRTHHVLDRLSTDWVAAFHHDEDLADAAWWNRYPGW